MENTMTAELRNGEAPVAAAAQAQQELSEMDFLWLEIYPAAACQLSGLHGVDADGNGHGNGAVSAASAVRLPQAPAWMEGLGRDANRSVTPSPVPSAPSSPRSTTWSRPPSARLAQCPVFAAGFVVDDASLAIELDAVHLCDGPEATNGHPASDTMTNIPPANSSSHRSVTAAGNIYASNNGAYHVAPPAQFQPPFLSQGIFPNPQLRRSLRVPPLPDRRNGAAASRMKYPGIHTEPRQVRIVRNNLMLQRWRRPYYTGLQWADLFQQLERLLQAKGDPVDVSSLLLECDNDDDGRPADAIYRIAQNKLTCLALQDMLKEGPHMVEMILDGVIDRATELMSDSSGNYFMQKLMEACSQEQLTEIILVARGHEHGLLRVCFDPHGTRSVQTLIRILENKQQISWVMAALRPGFLHLIKDSHGSHVVQTCLTFFTASENEFIFEVAAKHCVEISTHQLGCVTMQKCIDRATGGYQQRLALEVAANGYQLARHQFGNYVVQLALEKGGPMVSAGFALLFRGKYVELSKDKYASNVVERCLENFSDLDKHEIIMELLAHPFDLLMQDPFANYVIQAACRFYEGPLRRQLEATISAHHSLASNPYCKGIFSKLRTRSHLGQLERRQQHGFLLAQ